ncbi:hypothetical protein EMIHUDRAFT_208310 [Emiliania huxleyi CCMP1516]|uniref:F-box domain-containing protein n=2 Tax=Emiliania huxleyi TaxID=2903 RepID=A0A0D3JAC1_EMIH1|nr:hypothetical protein EMIHUDRAFT_208310 [Emiliania huxleyi CCMP1516]EOD20456.1 hypothetical protein EMIHUDRAFT_208310 [Emiliania huxleyi CCMP1516]|eukprot:XP_005772885.1 hypothetical protein EMIHUDRAFT_208310 [Emiliania huxleyi CCMP1516]
MGFDDLPEELVAKILTSCCETELLAVARLSRRLRRLASSDRLWRPLAEARFTSASGREVVGRYAHATRWVHVFRFALCERQRAALYSARADVVSAERRVESQRSEVHERSQHLRRLRSAAARQQAARQQEGVLRCSRAAVAELEAAVGQLEPTDPRQRALYRQRALAARHQAGPPAGRVVREPNHMPKCKKHRAGYECLEHFTWSCYTC